MHDDDTVMIGLPHCCGDALCFTRRLHTALDEELATHGTGNARFTRAPGASMYWRACFS